MAGALRLDGVAFDSDGSALIWLEGRSGQGVLVTSMGGEAARDVTVDSSVRARVGYGGGDFTVRDGTAFYAGPEGRLYRQALAGGEARPITPPFGQACSPAVSPDGRWVLYIHTSEQVDVIAIVDSEGRQWPQRLVTGHDFVMWPTWSPTGDAIAYVSWEHPLMPWDGSRLWLQPIDCQAAGGPVVAEPIAIAGSDRIAVGQPLFSPDGRWLAYTSDETGWAQLYLHALVGAAGQAAAGGAGQAAADERRLTTAEADHGVTAWGYGLRSFAWRHDSQALVYRRDERGFQSLWSVDVTSGENRPLAGELSRYRNIEAIVAAPSDERIACIAATATGQARVLVAGSGGGVQILRRSSAEQVAPAALAEPEPISWPSGDGSLVYGHYYPPTSQRFSAEGAAPLVVHVHGGPTSHARAGYNGQIQFLATRGYGVLAVNYRGSTAHGRAYMEALRGNWGLHDVEDSVAGARHLIGLGRANAEQLVIMGGSAGGYTVLQALIDHARFFRAGVCLYGVANHFALAAETHKFEARYLDSLLGPLPAAAAVYRERSPIFHVDRIVQPLAVFQGEEDQVVPRNQSDTIVESLRRRQVPHEYHLYPGEGHGWRRRETIEAFYKALDGFLKRYVIFA
jgi:dipeptidyl aminopeptidase/acylaminoacyl peptidase